MIKKECFNIIKDSFIDKNELSKMTKDCLKTLNKAVGRDISDYIEENDILYFPNKNLFNLKLNEKKYSSFYKYLQADSKADVNVGELNIKQMINFSNIMSELLIYLEDISSNNNSEIDFVKITEKYIKNPDDFKLEQKQLFLYVLHEYVGKVKLIKSLLGKYKGDVKGLLHYIVPFNFKKEYLKGSIEVIQKGASFVFYFDNPDDFNTVIEEKGDETVLGVFLVISKRSDLHGTIILINGNKQKQESEKNLLHEYQHLISYYLAPGYNVEESIKTEILAFITEGLSLRKIVNILLGNDVYKANRELYLRKYSKDPKIINAYVLFILISSVIANRLLKRKDLKNVLTLLDITPINQWKKYLTNEDKILIKEPIENINIFCKEDCEWLIKELSKGG